MPMLKINENTLTPVEKNWKELDVTSAAGGSLTDEYAVTLDNDFDVQAIDRALLQAGAIILTFPKFADGRAYSQARLLRERFSFRGKIIARGDVLADQILFMKRCGIDMVDLAHNDLTNFEHALAEFSHFYQPSADDIAPVWEKRSRARRAAA